MDKPIVVVLSADPAIKPETLIAKVRKLPAEERQEQLADDQIGYGYHIRTKYYETDVVFYCTDDLNALPEAILKQMEGLLIYFDAKNREFLNRLPDYACFVTDTGLEFGILLCSELQEETEQGITYREAKKFCGVLDVIELEPSGETEEGEAAGVDELIQAMHNFIWSNVNMSRKGGSAGGDEDETEQAEGAADAPASAEDERRIEDELKGFEKLLTQVMQFRPNTNSWTRNERLAYAQEFAEIFDELIGDED